MRAITATWVKIIATLILYFGHDSLRWNPTSFFVWTWLLFSSLIKSIWRLKVVFNGDHAWFTDSAWSVRLETPENCLVNVQFLCSLQHTVDFLKMFGSSGMSAEATTRPRGNSSQKSLLQCTIFITTCNNLGRTKTHPRHAIPLKREQMSGSTKIAKKSLKGLEPFLSYCHFKQRFCFSGSVVVEKPSLDKSLKGISRGAATEFWNWFRDDFWARAPINSDMQPKD